MLFVAAHFTSCRRGNSVSIEALTAIDSLVEEHPDSALALLRAIDTADIRSSECGAYYALLLTEAEDKNYIDRDDDNLISRASYYYFEHPKSDRDRAIRAFFYHARILYNARNYAEALVMLTQAENYAILDGNYHYLGLIYRNMADIYGETYLSRERLRYAKLAGDNFKKAGNPIYSEYADVEVAAAYIANQRDTTAIDILKNALTYSSLRDNPIQQGEAYKLLGMAYSNIDKPEFAIVNLKHAVMCDSDNFDWATAQNIVHNYVALDSIDSAIRVWHQYQVYAHTDEPMPYEIQIAKQNYKEGYSALYDEYRRLNELMYQQSKQSVTSTLHSFLKYQNRDLKQRNQIDSLHRKILIFIVCGVFVIVVICITLRFTVVRRRLTNKLSVADEMIASLNVSLEELNVANESAQKSVKNLMRTQSSVLSWVCEEYYASSGLKVTAHLLSQVADYIDNYKPGTSGYAYLEHLIDSHLNSCVTKLRKAMPALNDVEVAIFIYSCVGLSTKAISIMLDCKPQVISVRKTRLKKKISMLSVDDKELFLDMLK
jgi:tetratricopeptide (TPR) repeat protein